jgi:hypothetical protein
MIKIVQRVHGYGWKEEAQLETDGTNADEKG